MKGHHLKALFIAVTTCANGKQALDLLRDKTSHFDLVLSDVYMPGAGFSGLLPLSMINLCDSCVFENLTLSHI
jgi:CheY-like chemotaxis protein